MVVNKTKKNYDNSNSTNTEKELNNMIVKINNKKFTITLEQNPTTNELKKLINENGSLKVMFSDYGGFEKVGYLQKKLPHNDKHIRTEVGDIVLYDTNKIVIFYGSNSWSYTKIGRINEISQFKQILSSGTQEIIFELE